MSDGKPLAVETESEERDVQEVEYESSYAEPSSSKDGEKCAVCGVDKVTVDSRLHRISSWGKFRDRLISFEAIKSNSEDCCLCKLVMDAVTTWKKSDLSGMQVLAVSLYSLWVPNGRHFSINILDTMSANMSANRPQVYLDIFCMDGIESPWNVRELPEASGDTSSMQAATTIKQWISECQLNHEKCKSRGGSESFPDRILELSDNRIILRRNADLTSAPRYACLSHCWGRKGPSFRLTSATSEALMSGVSVEQLPQTFQDAIKLCLSIGLSYLWIDALCIHQDNEKDWEMAAASMADVYENATVTIAATCSSDSDQGLFSRTQDDMTAMPIRGTGLFVRRQKPWLPTTSYSGLNHQTWPLLTRAWVFQERKLSARVVHLARNQLHWECDTLVRSEDGDQFVQSNVYSNQDFRASLSDPREAWRTAVEHYSSLCLTYEKDRLPAISALVKRMQPLREGDTYVAGMWMDSLLQDLAWHTCAGRPEQRRPGGKYPTWSWISVDGGVSFSNDYFRLPTVQITNADYRITGPAHIGYAEDASITVVGSYTTAELLTYDWSSELVQKPFLLEHAFESDGYSIFSKQCVDYDYRTAAPPLLPGQDLTILLLAKFHDHWFPGCVCTCAIVLRSLEQDTYERVGFIELSDSDTNLVDTNRFIDSLPVKRFKIV